MIIDFEKIRMLSISKIIFGKDKILEVIELTRNKSVLMVCSRRTLKLLKDDNQFNLFFNKVKKLDNYFVENYPEISKFQEGIDNIKKFDYDFLLAIGGGSSIDSAKVLKALSCRFNDKDNLTKLLDDKNMLKPEAEIPSLIAIPTTAGTGSEVTPYATIWDFEKNKKYSIAANWLIPEYSIIDPNLLKTVSNEVAINTGLDAINQAFDSLWNKSATKATSELALIAIKDGMRILPTLEEKKFSSKEREIISRVSLYSGICIANTKTSICHSISYPITSNFGVPHGLACVFTMYSVLKMIYNEKTRESDQFLKLINLMWNKENKLTLLDSVETFITKMKIKNKIKKYINSIEDLLLISNQMYTPERMDNFIIPINQDKIINLLKDSWTFN